MTKKVISFFVLIVSLVICTANLYADYAGLTNKKFNLVLTKYEANYVSVTVKLKDSDEEITENNALEVSTSSTTSIPECQIVVDTNFNPNITVTFNRLKNTKNTKTTNYISYYVTIYQDGEVTPFKDIDNLYIEEDGTSRTFSSGTAASVLVAETYYYQMGFALDSAQIATGEYEAIITIKATNP